MTEPALEVLRPRRGVLVLSGYGVRIAVERGHLTVADGAGRVRRQGRFARVSPELRRLVVHGQTGSITLDALSWLRDTGVTFVQMTHDGDVVAINTQGALDDVRVRRGQALATIVPEGVEIARSLLTAKVEGQRDVLRDLGGRREAVQVLTEALAALGEATTLPALQYVESRAAAMYWDAWNGIPMRFGARDRSKVPAHWLAFDARRSFLTTSPRKASNPTNAILNYAYGVLEAEAQLAALRVGCDPAMGLIHADRPNRVSFACDLMEPIRPQIDAFVRQLLDDQTFLKADFFENREGHCRLMPPIAAALAETAPHWAKAVAPVAERAAWAFAQIPLAAPRQTADGQRPAVRLRTPLTQQNRRKEPSSSSPRVAAMESRCKECGGRLKSAKRTYCDTCLPLHAKRASEKAVVVQRQLRAIGHDRRQSPEVRAVHSQNARQQHVLNAAWEATQTSIPSSSVYRDDIRPYLRGIAPKSIATATGLSISSAKTILSGRMTPHPRHWKALRQLVEARRT